MIPYSSSMDFKERTELINELKDYVKDYCDIFNKCVLYGSTARGDFTEDSDVNLYLESGLFSSCLEHSSRYKKFISDLDSIMLMTVKINIEVCGVDDIKPMHSSLHYKFIDTDGIILYNKERELFFNFLDKN